MLVFLILLLLVTPVSFDFLTSATPGWHTTIYPPWFIGACLLLLVLLFAIMGYWLQGRRADKMNWMLFACHWVFTIAAILYLKFPSIFLGAPITNPEKLMKAAQLRVKLIPIAWGLFIIGQVFFLICYIRTIAAPKQGRGVNI